MAFTCKLHIVMQRHYRIVYSSKMYNRKRLRHFVANFKFIQDTDTVYQILPEWAKLCRR